MILIYKISSNKRLKFVELNVIVIESSKIHIIELHPNQESNLFSSLQDGYISEHFGYSYVSKI